MEKGYSDSQLQDIMEVTALCFKLLMDVLLLLDVQVQNCNAKKADAAFPQIAPNKLQFFEYESICVDCGELDYSSEWRVMRKLKEVPTNTTQWETSAGTITIKPAFTSDSGVYWCENKEGERSNNSVNITITASEVILESPTVPVMEEENVSLSCRNNIAASNLPADFYKDGLLSGTGYKGNFIINNVSKSHQGLYKCSISGYGESPESWLAVRAHITKSSKEIQENPESPDTSSTEGFPHLSILLSVVFTIFCVAVLLLVIGLYHCQKHRVACFSSEMPGTDPVSVEASVADRENVTYAVVTKDRKKRVSLEASVADRENVAYAVVAKDRKKRAEPEVSSYSARQNSSAGTKPNLTDNDVVYSTIQ